MTKQKQIEDFAEAIICAAITANAKIDDKVAINLKDFIESLFKAGYRKVPADTMILTENQLKKIIEEEYKKALKGKVVLTTEEYQDLVVKSMDNFSSAMVKARKETAENILKDFKLWAREYQYKDTVVDENGERPMTNNEKLNYLYTYLCDKYKVEIEEYEE